MYPKIIKRSLTLQYEAPGTAFIVQSTKYLGKFSESMELRDFPFDIQVITGLLRIPYHVRSPFCDIMIAAVINAVIISECQIDLHVYIEDSAQSMF